MHDLLAQIIELAHKSDEEIRQQCSALAALVCWMNLREVLTLLRHAEHRVATTALIILTDDKTMWIYRNQNEYMAVIYAYVKMAEEFADPRREHAIEAIRFSVLISRLDDSYKRGYTERIRALRDKLSDNDPNKAALTELADLMPEPVKSGCTLSPDYLDEIRYGDRPTGRLPLWDGGICTD